MNLTEEQQAVIECRDSRILVNAYAGTGKTETTAHRVASLRNEHRPVLLLCFTRAAQQQLSDRLKRMGVKAKVRTLHSFAHDLVRRWHDRNSVPMPSLTTDLLLRKVIQRHGYSPTTSNVEAIQRASTFVANGRRSGFPQSSEFDGETAVRILREYVKEKEETNRVDYDDLIGMATEITGVWHGEIIVDEAQDLSNLQIRFLEAMTGPDTTVTWIGDRWQSIFNFAGVDDDIFQKRVAWRQLTLTQSFRSASEVLTVANQLIPDEIRSELTGGKVDVRTRTTSETMSDLVDWVTGNDAILARTKSELQQISAHLLYAGKKYSFTPFSSNDAADLPALRPTVLSTVHAAKGLEWDRVAVVGLNGRSFGAFDPTSEEARLFYVSATRSKTSLTLFTQDAELPFEVEV